MMKAILYVQVFEDAEKAAPMFREIEKNFGRLSISKEAGMMAGELEKRAAEERAFKPGMAFPAVAGRPRGRPSRRPWS